MSDAAARSDGGTLLTRELGRAGSQLSLGVEIVASLAVGHALGRALDGTFDSWPWMTWLWTLSGVGAAVRALVRAHRRAQAEVASAERRERDERERWYRERGVGSEERPRSRSGGS